MTASTTVSALFERVVKPLVLGGAFRPLEPIGPSQALALAQQGAESITAADASWVTVGRVRRARGLCPVDTLPAISISEWLMIVALNDLIRSTDPQIGSLFASDRATQVVDGAIEVLAQVPAVGTVGEALARHATFASMMSLRRRDTMVAWWCGSRSFAGREPPERLLAWPKVRRVRTESTELDLTAMSMGSELARGTYLEAIQALLARSPLTDLATVGRRAPVFVWSAPTVSLLSGTTGRNVAMRAVRNSAPGNALTALRKAAASLSPPPSASVRTTVHGVIQELEAWGNAA